LSLHFTVFILFEENNIFCASLMSKCTITFSLELSYFIHTAHTTPSALMISLHMGKQSHLFEKVTHILLHIMQGTSYLGKNVIFYPHYNLWLTPTTLDVLLMWDHGIVPKTFWNGSVGTVQAEPFQQAQCYGD